MCPCWYSIFLNSLCITKVRIQTLIHPSYIIQWKSVVNYSNLWCNSLFNNKCNNLWCSNPCNSSHKWCNNLCNLKLKSCTSSLCKPQCNNNLCSFSNNTMVVLLEFNLLPRDSLFASSATAVNLMVLPKLEVRVALWLGLPVWFYACLGVF